MKNPEIIRRKIWTIPNERDNRASGNFLILNWKITVKMIGQIKNFQNFDWKIRTLSIASEQSEREENFQSYFGKTDSKRGKIFKSFLIKLENSQTRASENFYSLAISYWK